MTGSGLLDVAGIIAILGALGGAGKWLFDWLERREQRRIDQEQRREDDRAAKLQKWHDELDARETRLDTERETHLARIERRMEQMENELDALRNAYRLATAALRAIDPGNSALRMADELLRAAFPINSSTPPDMAAQLRKLD